MEHALQLLFRPSIDDSTEQATLTAAVHLAAFNMVAPYVDFL
jgi:hypothetical protein